MDLEAPPGRVINLSSSLYLGSQVQIKRSTAAWIFTQCYLVEYKLYLNKHRAKLKNELFRNPLEISTRISNEIVLFEAEQ